MLTWNEVSARIRRAKDAMEFGQYRLTKGQSPSTFHVWNGDPQQEEAYVVVSGSGRALLDDEVVQLRQFHLKLPFRRIRVLGEDIQDQGRTIDHLYLFTKCLL